MDEIEVDENGYVWLGGLKICRLTPWGLVEFYDRDKRRADRRGSHFVYTTPNELERIFTLIKKVPNEVEPHKIAEVITATSN